MVQFIEAGQPAITLSRKSLRVVSLYILPLTITFLQGILGLPIHDYSVVLRLFRGAVGTCTALLAIQESQTVQGLLAPVSSPHPQNALAK